MEAKYIFDLKKGYYKNVYERLDIGIQLAARMEKVKYQLNLIILLDISLSMSHNKKLAHVVASIDYLLRYLDSFNRINLALFNDQVATYSDQFIELTDQNREKIREYLRNIRASGNTNIGEILNYLKKAITKSRSLNGITAIMFLTDGEASVGPTGKELYRKFKTEILPILENDIILYTFGYGRDHNSQFLSKMAISSNQGLYYYISQPGFIGGIFGTAISNLKNIVANNIKIHISVESGTRILSLTNSRARKQKIEEIEHMKQYKMKLGNLLKDEEMVILSVISINKVANLGIQNLMNVEIEYLNPSKNDCELIKIQMEPLKIERTMENFGKDIMLSRNITNNLYRQKAAKAIDKAIKLFRKKQICELIGNIDSTIKVLEDQNKDNLFIGNLISDLEFSKVCLSNGNYLHYVYSLCISHYTARNVGLSKKTLESIGNKSEISVSRYQGFNDEEDEETMCLETIALAQRYSHTF